MGALNFSDLTFRACYPFSFQNRCYLFFGKGIALNCSGTAQSANMIYFTQAKSAWTLKQDPITLYGSGNFRNKIQGFAADKILRLVNFFFHG